MIFIISAPSGAGKTTIVNELTREVPKLARLTTTTTRSPRGDEVDGRDYTFVSEETFLEMIEAGEFIEWKKTYGNYYGIPKQAIAKALDSDFDFVLILDVYGRQELVRGYPSCVSIFIMPPDVEELRQRLAERGQCPGEEMNARVSRIEEELAFAPLYDHVVVNRCVDEAVNDVADIIARYRAR